MKKQARDKLTPVISGLLSALAATASANERQPASSAAPHWLAPYQIVWNSQSTNSSDSMPLAGGNLGLNVWVENGDLRFLIASPNNMDEQGMQTKLGLIRLHFDKGIFGETFQQKLNLERSEITVSGNVANVRLWCEVLQPVIHVEVSAKEPVALTTSYETWSNYEAKFVPDGLQWMRRLNPRNDRRARDMHAQGMTEFAGAIPDPLRDLTTGGRLTAAGLVEAGMGVGTFNGLKTKTWSVKTATPVMKLDVCFALRMEQDTSVADWEAGLAALARRSVADAGTARENSLAWWKQFWERSRIVVNPGNDANDKAWQAGRNYQLFRYLLAANRTGSAMTLFNGGNFTCTGNPDRRNWDYCQFMAQNQMLVYWPLLRSGDFDLLKVGTDFYNDRTEMRRLHAKKFWGVEGVTYPEPLGIFGLDAIGTTPDGRSSPRHLPYHYTSGMTFALMMLGHDSYTGRQTPGYTDAAFGIISYYDQYYQKKLLKETGNPLDADGKLVIYPSDACEPYHGCVNNLDVLAGLQALTRDLLDTPTATLDPHRRAYLEGFRRRIPEFKTEEKNGRKLYAAADKPPEWIFHNANMDFPQMYICFPFSAVSLGRSDMTLVKNTWELGPVNATVQHQNQCWYQNSINLARMGETAKAADLTLRKLLHGGLRFPAFYYTTFLDGGSFCHPPDHDHGGVAMIALQEMLMQTDGKRMLLFPAWPPDWDVDFKLHAPERTTVEGKVRGGKLVSLSVTPLLRRADVEVLAPYRDPLVRKE